MKAENVVEEMTGRERVLTALAHREPDRVPIDFGSTWITTITIPAYERLKEHLGLDAEPPDSIRWNSTLLWIRVQ